jgi:hypothetical protein
MPVTTRLCALPCVRARTGLGRDDHGYVYDLDSDTFRWTLSNTAPVLASTNLLSNITQISTGNGYTQMTDGAGGLVATMSALSSSGQTTTMAQSANVVLTATGAVGPFQYLILVDDTPTSPLNPVVGWLNHGSAVTMANTDTYTIPSGNLLQIG